MRRQRREALAWIAAEAVEPLAPNVADAAEGEQTLPAAEEEPTPTGIPRFRGVIPHDFGGPLQIFVFAPSL